ncbi:hypothetical protein ACFL6W_07700 [Thermodesulfobacteriota bacterium]
MFLKTERESSLIHPDWPEVKWNISGLFNYRYFLRVLINTLNTHDILHVLGSFHGCPDLIWNGGHLNANVRNTDSVKFFDTLNKHGMGVFLTFSNAFLEEKHLSDAESNLLMEKLDEECGLNGIMVASDILSDYIRKKKPGLKQICSMEKSFIENPDGGIEWYSRMQERFDRVTIHPDHVFDLDLLDKLDRGKTEILVNDECAYKCPNRKRQQELISQFNLTGSKQALDEIIKIKQTLCSGEFRTLSQEKNPAQVRSCYLKQKEIKTIYDMGFRNFSICGRRKTMYGMAWNVIHSVFNPALAAPFSAAFAHKIDENIRGEFQKLGQKEEGTNEVIKEDIV